MKLSVCKTFSTSFFVMILLTLLVAIENAFAVGMLELPTAPVTTNHGNWNQGTLGGTIDITLSGIPSGFDVTNGKYPGWCMEDNFQPNFPNHTLLSLLDSTDDESNLPSSYQGIPWDKVNYLMNHKTGTIKEIQAALWILIWEASDTFPVTATAQGMINDANTNGQGFVPNFGEVVVVLLYGDGIGYRGYQDTLIELNVPANRLPIPNIKANGSNGPITVSSGTPVSVTVGLDPGDKAGQNADWWIAVQTPFSPPEDWYTYVYPTGWLPGINFCAQTGLFDLSPFEVLNMTLPVGNYTFYFALDDPDEAATGPWWGIDWVEVQVQ